jgi:hypothetical protein
MMRPEDRQLLQSVRKTWAFVSYAKPRRHRGDAHAPRASLRRLVALGFIEVRTVTIAHWKSDPRVVDVSTPRIEARLTAQGLDVREAQRA